MCKAVFSIEREGRFDIKQHMKKKNNTCRLNVSKSYNLNIVYFFKQGLHDFTSKRLKMSVQKPMFAECNL